MPWTKNDLDTGDTITNAAVDNIDDGIFELFDDLFDKLTIAEVDSSGTSLTGFNKTGWTTSKLGTGRYRVTFNVFSTTFYRVLLTPRQAGGSPVVATIAGTSSGYFDVDIHDLSGSPIDCGFIFLLHRTS